MAKNGVYTFSGGNPLRSSRNVLKTTQPTSRDSYDKLCNRLLICLLAICILWMTSLQLCVGIVSVNIGVPTLISVVHNCQYAFNQVQEQRDFFTKCARQQIAACNHQLDSAYLGEKIRAQSVKQVNEKFMERYVSIVNNCSSAYDLARGALRSWSSTNALEQEILYHHNCTPRMKDSVSTAIGDSAASQRSIVATSEEYSVASDNTIIRLAEYSSALSAYNREYVHNKTQALQNLAQVIVHNISMPYVNDIFPDILDPVAHALDQLIACATLNNATTTACSSLSGVGGQQSLLEAYEEMQLVANNRLQAVDDIQRKLLTTVDAYVDSVDHAIAAADQFYDSVAGASGLAAWVVANTGIRALCGKSSPNWCDFSKADWFVNPPNLPNFPSLPLISDASKLYSDVKQVEVTAQNTVSEAMQEMTEKVEDWAQDLLTALSQADFAPNDYNPPSYPYLVNHSDESVVQAERTTSFLTDIREILVGNTTVKTTNEAAATTLNITLLFAEQHGMNSLSAFQAEWEQFSEVAGLDLTVLLESLLTIQGLLYMFDYVYRIFQTIKLLSRFWSKGVVKLPNLDARARGETGIPNFYFSYITLGCNLLPFVSMQLLLIAFFATIIVWSVIVIFAPGYSSYVTTCVHSEANHTYISQNLHSLAVNYAALDGNTDITRGLADYNAKVTEFCAVESSRGTQSYLSSLQEAYELNHTLSVTLARVEDLSRCVDIPAMDDLFYRACCSKNSHNTYNYFYDQETCSSGNYPHLSAVHLDCPLQDDLLGRLPYQPVSSYLSDSSCSSDGWLTEFSKKDEETSIYIYQHNTSIDNSTSFDQTTNDAHVVVGNGYGVIQRDATFQCLALPQCKLTCSGPDSLLIETLTKHCSCMSEWYFNGYLVLFSLAFGVFVFVNMSRVLLIKGLVRIFWSHLTPSVFEYTANYSYSYTYARNSPRLSTAGLSRNANSKTSAAAATRHTVSLGHPSSIFKFLHNKDGGADGPDLPIAKAAIDDEHQAYSFSSLASPSVSLLLPQESQTHQQSQVTPGFWNTLKRLYNKIQNNIRSSNAHSCEYTLQLQEMRRYNASCMSNDDSDNDTRGSNSGEEEEEDEDDEEEEEEEEEEEDKGGGGGKMDIEKQRHDRQLFQQNEKPLDSAQTWSWEKDQNLELKNFIGTRMERKLKMYVMQGYLCVVVGLLVNVPWIMALLLVRNNIEYSPNDSAEGH